VKPRAPGLKKLPVSQALQQRVCRHDAFTPTQDSATRGRMVDQRRLIGPFINKPQALLLASSQRVGELHGLVRRPHRAHARPQRKNGEMTAAAKPPLTAGFDNMNRPGFFFKGYNEERPKKALGGLTPAAILDVIKQHPAAFKTITFSTGTEFHDYKRLEVGSNLRCYFANSASYQMLRPNDVSTARWALRNASTKRC
jgi:hypothetical protein